MNEYTADWECKGSLYTREKKQHCKPKTISYIVWKNQHYQNINEA